MSECPICGRRTVDAMDPRCALCIHQGRELPEEQEKQEEPEPEEGSQSGLAGFGFGEEVGNQ